MNNYVDILFIAFQRKKFLKEGRILKQYDHRNIVKLNSIDNLFLLFYRKKFLGRKDALPLFTH